MCTSIISSEIMSAIPHWIICAPHNKHNQIPVITMKFILDIKRKLKICILSKHLMRTRDRTHVKVYIYNASASYSYTCCLQSTCKKTTTTHLVELHNDNRKNIYNYIYRLASCMLSGRSQSVSSIYTNDPKTYRV